MPKKRTHVSPPQFSIVIPFFNEAASLTPVCEEINTVLADNLDFAWELIMVDDGSTDQTPSMIDGLASQYDHYRALHLVPHSGQSAALKAGFKAARGELIATMDGDGQNDPNDLIRLLTLQKEGGLDMLCGVRSNRADSLVRKISSRIANRVRSGLLKDGITDVGCSLRIFRRECLDRIYLFHNFHRFFPALLLSGGYMIGETPVNHRSRLKGKSRYGGGIRSRLFTGVIDLAGVYWLQKRSLNYQVHEKESFDEH